MMSLLVIRADADATIGTGHIMRCLALAQEWLRQGGEVVFLGRIEAETLRQRLVAEGCRLQSVAVSHPAPGDLAMITTWLAEKKGSPGWLVLDGYHFDTLYHDAIRATGWSLLVIDDYAHLPEYHADILLNPNVYAEELSYHASADTTRLLGSRFAPLRREFQLAREQGHDKANRGRRVLVTMGGADQENISGRILAAIAATGRDDLDVKIVIGPLNPHQGTLAEQLPGLSFQVELLEPVTDMAPLMQWADLAISAAGSTCWELAALGVPMLVTVLADNQERLAASLAGHGAVVNLGWHHQWQQEEAAAVIGGLLADHERRRLLGENGRRLIDGRGCERLVDALRLFHFSLRPAMVEDCELVYEWANDPFIRAVSFNSHCISWEEHCRWFHERLADTNHLFLLAIAADGSPLGVARFALVDGEAVISVSLAKEFRGLGLGSRLIREACRRAMAERNIDKIRAKIKEENKRSINAFSRAGFQMVQEASSGGESMVAMEYSKEAQKEKGSDPFFFFSFLLFLL